MNKTTKELFEQFCKLAQLPTTSERTDKKPGETGDYYKNAFWILEYASHYGGYRIAKVMPSTGQDTPFGLGRKSKKEMENFLRGLIAGLTFNR